MHTNCHSLLSPFASSNHSSRLNLHPGEFIVLQLRLPVPAVGAGIAAFGDTVVNTGHVRCKAFGPVCFEPVVARNKDRAAWQITQVTSQAKSGKLPTRGETDAGSAGTQLARDTLAEASE